MLKGFSRASLARGRRVTFAKVDGALARPVKAARMVQEFALTDQSHFEGLDTWTR